jgi:basic amino acid/polyamine antiporter, APA family
VAVTDESRTLRRALGSTPLFAVVYTAVAAAIYFSLGVVVDRALGLTPVVFLIVGVFFALTAMTYVEGASLHQERAGSTVFARYAFNELWSFIAGWAILLDFLMLVAVCSVAATNYLAVFWGDLGQGAPEAILTAAIIVYVAIRNVRGLGAGRTTRIARLVVADLALQALIIVIGLALFLDPGGLTDSIVLGSAPRWEDFIFALTVGTVAFAGLESASGLAGEVAVGRRGLKRLVASAAGVVLVIYTGIALVAVSALPVEGTTTPLDGSAKDAPVAAVVGTFDPVWLGDGLRYTVGVLAAVTLVVAANSAMLGLSRLAYSLARNRQIPSLVGRLHPQRATPYVVIAIAAALTMAVALPGTIDFLIGIYAFGALLAFLIAHASIIALRFKEPDRPRPYRMPLNVRVRGAELPLPAVVGAVGSAFAFASLVVFHEGARYVGVGWMTFGLVLYVVYRTGADKPVFRRVSVPEAALKAERVEVQYGSILVPVSGSPLDDDIVQTAGRLAAEEHHDPDEGEGATIEALWVFEVPMSLPIDARLPEAQLEAARAALRRAKAVGEEYAGVEVATATVRARRTGQAIVEEARRRGVEVIVLAAEEPTRIRSGARLGGRGGPLDNFVGEVTKYVVTKAPCRVVLTAPPAEEMEELRGRAAGAGRPPDQADAAVESGP